jgi:hypothetical protein
MRPSHIHDQHVIATVQDWLAYSHELWVELYYPHSGAGGTFYLVSTAADFHDLVHQARVGAIFFILRQQQYPIRGIVGDAFIQDAVENISDGTAYEIVDLAVYPTALSFYGSGYSDHELREDLNQCRGVFVGLGKLPAAPDKYWVENASSDSIVASKS